jgi:hypothetical protein
MLASGDFLVEHLAEVAVLVIALRLGRVVDGCAGRRRAGLLRLGHPERVELPARRQRPRPGQPLHDLHRVPEAAEMAQLLGIPGDVTQVCLLPVAYYTGDTFRPAPRLPVEEVTFVNHWGTPPDVTGP